VTLKKIQGAIITPDCLTHAQIFFFIFAILPARDIFFLDP